MVVSVLAFPALQIPVYFALAALQAARPTGSIYQDGVTYSWWYWTWLWYVTLGDVAVHYGVVALGWCVVLGLRVWDKRTGGVGGYGWSRSELGG